MIGSVELERLTGFLEDGKALYIEGYNFPSDHYYYSDFINLLGYEYVEDGNIAGDINVLNGIAGSFAEGMNFEYLHTPHPLCRSDVIAAKSGHLLFASQDNWGYAVAFDSSHYKVIVSTFLFGALDDGQGINLKKELMNRYLNFFMNPSSVSRNRSDPSAPLNFRLFPSYPNPFHQSTTINFHIAERSEWMTLTIFNTLGQEVKKLMNGPALLSTHSVVWDGTDHDNVPVPAGTYFYQLRVGESVASRKVILLR